MIFNDLNLLAKCTAFRRMEVDDYEGDVGARLRPIFCSLGEITRADGSVMLCQVVILWWHRSLFFLLSRLQNQSQGDTTVACSVYGPGEVRQARELIDRYNFKDAKIDVGIMDILRTSSQLRCSLL